VSGVTECQLTRIVRCVVRCTLVSGVTECQLTGIVRRVSTSLLVVSGVTGYCQMCQ